MTRIRTGLSRRTQRTRRTNSIAENWVRGTKAGDPFDRLRAWAGNGRQETGNRKQEAGGPFDPFDPFDKLRVCDRLRAGAGGGRREIWARDRWGLTGCRAFLADSCKTLLDIRIYLRCLCFLLFRKDWDRTAHIASHSTWHATLETSCPCPARPVRRPGPLGRTSRVSDPGSAITRLLHAGTKCFSVLL